MQSEASSQQLSTHSNKTGSDQTASSQVQGSVYDPISVGSSRRSSESGEPLPNGLTTHLHRMHARAQASQHLSNTSNLVVLSQNESLASDSEGFQQNFRSGSLMPPVQTPAPRIGQRNTNQPQPLATLNGKQHHPNQDIILGQLDENKPIEENKELILPDEMVNYLNELAEQSNRPPSVISDAVTSVSRYVPPNTTMSANSQTKPPQNAACTNHSHSQNCAQMTSQNWQPCSSCQTPHNSCAMQNACVHNHPNFSNGNPQTMQNCCHPNKPTQPPVQGCYNEMQKPALAHPNCSSNASGSMQKGPYNQSNMPYTASIPPSNAPSCNPVQNNSYEPYSYPQQQGMNMNYSEPQHFNTASSVHTESVPSYPKNNYVPNNSDQSNNYLQSRSFMGNAPMQYPDNQPNLYPSQVGIQPNGFNSAASSHHGSCPQPNYSSHNRMDKHMHSPVHVPQYNTGQMNHNNHTALNINQAVNHSNQAMNHNNLAASHNLTVTQNNMPFNCNNLTMNQNNVSMNHNLATVNHNSAPNSQCTAVPINQNHQVHMHHNNQMPFKQTVNMNHNLQVMHSDNANQHLNYVPQNNTPYSTSSPWCNNHAQNYNYNPNCNPATYPQGTAPNVPHNQNSGMHPQHHMPQGYNNNNSMPHQPCMHKPGMNRQCTSACNYNNQMPPNRTDPMQYQMQQQQQTPAQQMQYPVIPPNQYQDPKFINSESQLPMSGNMQNPVETACQNQLPSDLLSGDGHCCNHRLGTSIQAQHSASSIGDQDEKESSVSAIARSSHTCSTSDQREIQCQNVSQSSLSGEAYQRTLKYVQQCQEFFNQQQPSPGCNRVSSSTDRLSPAESHSPLLQTSNMVINDLNSGLHSLVEETRYLQLLH